MDTRKPLYILSVMTVSLLVSNAHAESLLRVGCLDEADKARVFINGQYTDTCPANLFLEPGRKKVRVVQPINDEYERVFETELELRPNSSKRIDVNLSDPRLTAQAKREKADNALSEAEAGDIASMRDLAAFFRDGEGVEQNLEKAQYWDNKAIEAELAEQAETHLQQAGEGDIDAMRKVAELYEKGRGVDKDSDKASQWRSKADQLEAEQTLAVAESGDVDAMRAVAELYAKGKGVEQDRTKSEAWARKAEEITQARRDEEKAKLQREQAQEQLASIDFFENSKVALAIEADDPNDPLEVFVLSTFSPALTVTGVMMDVVAAPTKTAEVAQLREAVAARPSIFGNPDSMIAKAYRSKNP